MTVSDILKLIGSLSTREQNMLRTLLLNDATKVIKIEQLIIETRHTSGISCPHCGCVEGVSRNGHRKDGTQRYLCTNCGKSSVATTNSITSGTRKDLETWKQFIRCMVNGFSVRKTAVKYKNKYCDMRNEGMNKMSLDKVVELLENDASVLERFVNELKVKDEERRKRQKYVTENIAGLFNELMDYLNTKHYITDESILYDRGTIPENIREYFSDIFDVFNDYAKDNYLIRGCDTDYRFLVKADERVVSFGQRVGQGVEISAVIESNGGEEFFTIEQFVNGYEFDTTMKRNKIALEEFQTVIRVLDCLKIEKHKLVDLFMHALFAEESCQDEENEKKL